MTAAEADIEAVVDEVVELLRAVPDLRAHAYDPSDGEAHPPFIAVMDVAPDYNRTFGAGMTGLTLRLKLDVGGQVNRATQTALRKYLANTGTHSIRAALEDAGAYTTFDSLEVTGYDQVGFEDVAESLYYGGIFTVDILV